MIIEKYNNRDEELILAISLGSKSSALLTKSTGEILGSFKEEQFTNIKNDSSFPINSVEKLLNTYLKYNLYQITVTITHWFNSKNSNKTWERYYTDIRSLISVITKDKNVVIKKIIESNDLHYCLSDTARSYTLSNNLLDLDDKPVTVIVCNRFGNFENVISTYNWENKQSFIEGKEPKINKLNDFKSSIGIMQQIASKICGYSEYDINRSLLTQYNDFKVSNIDDIEIYKNPEKWTYHNTYNDKVLFNSNISNEDLVNDAIKKSKDVYDYRPLNVKKIEQINMFYSEDFKKYEYNEVLEYIQNYTYTAFCDIIKPFLNGDIIVIGDAFVSKKINDKVKELTNNKFIVSPLLEDNSAIFGATNKILEKIYYNILCLKNINTINRNIEPVEVIEYELEGYDINSSKAEISKYLYDRTIEINVNDHNSKDFNSILNGLLNGDIYNFITNKASFSDGNNYESVSISLESNSDALKYLVAYSNTNITYDLKYCDNELLCNLQNAIGEKLVCLPFTNNDNITPIDVSNAYHTIMQQIERKESIVFDNNINLIIIN